MYYTKIVTKLFVKFKDLKVIENSLKRGSLSSPSRGGKKEQYRYRVVEREIKGDFAIFLGFPKRLYQGSSPK